MADANSVPWRKGPAQEGNPWGLVKKQPDAAVAAPHATAPGRGAHFWGMGRDAAGTYLAGIPESTSLEDGATATGLKAPGERGFMPPEAELWDVLDGSGRKTGETVARGVPHEPIPDVEPRCQAEEVSEAKWAGREEILNMIADGIFISHLDPGLAGSE